MNKLRSIIFLLILSLWAINCSAADDERKKTIFIQNIDDGITLGLVITELNDDDKEELKVAAGAKVLHVLEESQAEKAGLKENDVIVEFEGEGIEEAKELNDLVEEIEGEKNVTMSIIRDGSKKSINATIKPGDDDKYISLKMTGESDGDSWTWEMSESEGDQIENLAWIGEEDGDKVIIKEFAGMPGKKSISILGGHGKGGFLGVVTDNLSKQMLEYFEVKHGVVIKEIVEDSPAEKAGLKAGDVITFIEDRKIEDYSDLTRTISFYNPDEEINIDFVRKGSRKNADVKLAKKKSNRSFLHGKGGDEFIFNFDEDEFHSLHKEMEAKGKNRPFMFKKFGFKDHHMNIYII